MTNLTRRKVLIGAAASAMVAGVSATANAASFGNPDRPPEGAVNALNKQDLTNPGPQNSALAEQFPSFQNAPSTDVNGMSLFWSSFNNAHKLIQNGGS